MPEVRRLVLAMAEPEEQKRAFRLAWSRWRRAHQALAARYRKASRAAKRVLSGEAALEDRAGGHATTRLCAEEGAPLTDKEWEHVEPLLPHKPPAGGRYHDHRRVVGGIKWVARTGSSWRDAGGVRQVGECLSTLRVVVKAGSLAAHPRSVGRRGVTGTGDQITVTDAVAHIPQVARAS